MGLERTSQESSLKAFVFLGDGISMTPIIPPHSFLRLESCDPEFISPADIVVYTGRKHLVCHRVLLRRESQGLRWFYLSGNNPETADGWIPEYRILGRVVSINGEPVDLFKWRVRLQLFQWHGVVQLYLLHKCFENRMVKWIECQFNWNRWKLAQSFISFSQKMVPNLISVSDD